VRGEIGNGYTEQETVIDCGRSPQHNLEDKMTDENKQPKKQEPKFKEGDEVRLVNAWSQQFNDNGVKAVVKTIRHDADGEPVYFVDAERPPIPVQATEAELKI
jgi:transcription antitermination factor NusG